MKVLEAIYQGAQRVVPIMKVVRVRRKEGDDSKRWIQGGEARDKPWPSKFPAGVYLCRVITFNHLLKPPLR